MEEIYDLAEIYEDRRDDLVENNSSYRRSSRDTIIGKEIVTSSKIDCLRSKVRKLEVMRRGCDIIAPDPVFMLGDKTCESEISNHNSTEVKVQNKNVRSPNHDLVSYMVTEGEVQSNNDLAPGNDLSSCMKRLRTQLENHEEEITSVKTIFRKELDELKKNHTAQVEKQRAAHYTDQAELEAKLTKLIETEIGKVNSKMALISTENQQTIRSESDASHENVSNEKYPVLESLIEFEQSTLLEVTVSQKSKILELQTEIEVLREMLQVKDDQKDLLSKKEEETSDLRAQLADAKAEIVEKEKLFTEQVEKTRKRDLRITKLRKELSRARRALLKFLPSKVDSKRKDDEEGNQTHDENLQKMAHVVVQEEVLKARVALKVRGEKYKSSYYSSDDCKSTGSKTTSISTRDSKTSSRCSSLNSSSLNASY